MPSQMSNEEDSTRPPGALVWERNSLVRERACLMLEGEGFAPCAVGQAGLFDDLYHRAPFDLLVVGLTEREGLPKVAQEATKAPLLVLAPLEDRALVAHLRVLLPHGQIVDRSLSEPDAISRALTRATESPREDLDPAEAIRNAFAPFGLSERQLQVTELALLGESRSEIARRIYVSEMTVRNHLHAIYERVGVSGRRELLGRFVRGLLESRA